jgi:hypothetical protein
MVECSIGQAFGRFALLGMKGWHAERAAYAPSVDTTRLPSAFMPKPW